MKSAEAFDRRIFGRRRTSIQASVRMGYRVVSCTIKDLSEGGALLEFAERVDLPVRVWLSWPDQPNEVVCEVRHTRLNTAGVQFVRPQALNLKPTVTPADVFRHAVAAHDERAGASGNDLVAEHRRTLRQFPAQAATAENRATVHTAAGAETPRDLTALKASLEAAAMAIVAEREARRVPKPMPAYSVLPAAVQPPASAVTPRVPLPSVLTRAGLPVLARPVMAPLDTVPLPLPANVFWAATEAARETQARVLPEDFRAAADVLLAGCAGHACSFAVWRSLANLPPRPLPARAYRSTAGVA